MSDLLYAIFRPAPDKKPAKGCVHVHLDGAGRAYTPSTFGTLARSVIPGRPHFVYEIKVDEVLEIYDRDLVIRTFRTKERSDFRIRLRLVARTAMAGKIAESLHDGTDGPGAMLLKTLAQSLKAMTEAMAEDGPERIINRILSDRDTWAARLAEKVENRLGFETSIVFEGKHESVVTEISVVDVMVKPRDAPHRETLGLTVYTTLEKTSDRVREQLPESMESCRAILRTIVIDAVRTDVTLFQYWFDQTAVENAIRHRADIVLRSFAYRCGDLRVDPVRSSLRIEEQVAVAVPWSGYRGREVVFHIDSLMRLRENGAGIYDSLGQPNRRDWLQARGKAALHAAMHARDFYDLTLAQQKVVEDQVRDILSRDAARIGHDIEPIVARLRLPENRWLDRQFVEIPPATYPMKNALALADFGATIELKFGRLRPLIDYIDHQGRSGLGGNDAVFGNDTDETFYDSKIEPQIIALVAKTITVIMRDIETVQYFAKWEKWDLPFEEDDVVRVDNRNYVRNTVISEIRRELLRRFDLEIVNVRLHRLDSEVTRLWALIRSLGPFDILGITHPARSISEAESIDYRLRALPNEVPADQWPKVLGHGADYFRKEAITTSIADAAREFLAERTRDELADINLGNRATSFGPSIKTALEAHVSLKLLDIYGFTIKLDSVETGHSRIETASRRTYSLRVDDQIASLDVLDLARESKVDRIRTEIIHSRALLDRLRADVLANRRDTDQSEAKYHRDQQLIAAEQSKIAAATDEMDRLATERVAAQGILGAARDPEGDRSTSDPSPYPGSPAAAPGDRGRHDEPIIVEPSDDDIVPPSRI